jgi:hypothetical protein
MEEKKAGEKGGECREKARRKKKMRKSPLLQKLHMTTSTGLLTAVPVLLILRRSAKS